MAVVVVVLVVEAAVLEGLVPFFVPVTNSIWRRPESTEYRYALFFLPANEHFYRSSWGSEPYSATHQPQ